MPPKKKAGRPIKRFPEIPPATSTSGQGISSPETRFLRVLVNQTEDLDILANAAQSVDFNFEKAWPKLDEATERLEHLRTLKSDRGFSKENRRKLVDAIYALHTILLAPSPILNNTPDLYKDEFKDRAIALTGEYILFSVEVAPKRNDREKEEYLLMVEERLIKPIRGQPSLWGHHSLQIMRAVSSWDEVLKTTYAAIGRSSAQTKAQETPVNLAAQYQSQPPPHPELRPDYIQQHQSPYRDYPSYGQQYAPAEIAHPRMIYQRPVYFPPSQALPAPPDPNLRGPQLPHGQHNMPSPIPLHRPTPIHPQHHPHTEVPQVSNDVFMAPLPAPLGFPPSVTPAAALRRPQLDPDPRPEIRRHPAYLPKMQEIYGEVPPRMKIEIDSDSDDPEEQMRTPPKRPISTGSEQDFLSKRQRTESGVQYVQVVTDKKDMVDGVPEGRRVMRRSLSRQEIRYQEIAKEHEEDARVLANQPNHPVDITEIAATPVLNNDDEIIELVPRQSLKRCKSRPQEELEDELTPAIRELMTPVPREGSPDREGWEHIRSSSAYTSTLIPHVQGKLPSHIRQPNQPSHNQLMFLPPGGNALGAKSPELPEERKDVRQRFEHSPSAETVELPVDHHRQLLPMPKSAAEMPGLMAIHDRINSSKPIQQRDFYLMKRSELIGKGNEWSKPARDGMIRIGRYFYLAPEEIDEASEYLHYLTGHEVMRPKTMIRLTCRPRNGEQPGENIHAWPDHTMVFLNGKSLITSMVETSLRILIVEYPTVHRSRRIENYESDTSQIPPFYCSGISSMTHLILGLLCGPSRSLLIVQFRPTVNLSNSHLSRRQRSHRNSESAIPPSKSLSPKNQNPPPLRRNRPSHENPRLRKQLHPHLGSPPISLSKLIPASRVIVFCKECERWSGL